VCSLRDCPDNPRSGCANGSTSIGLYLSPEEQVSRDHRLGELGTDAVRQRSFPVFVLHIQIRQSNTSELRFETMPGARPR
jgi:hypothetical protein